jgi:hypothetical protein
MLYLNSSQQKTRGLCSVLHALKTKRNGVAISRSHLLAGNLSLNKSHKVNLMHLCLRRSFATMWDLRLPHHRLWRMSSTRMHRPVDLVKTDVSDKYIASISRLEKSSSVSVTLTECRFLQNPHGITSQKKIFLIVSQSLYHILSQQESMQLPLIMISI